MTHDDYQRQWNNDVEKVNRALADELGEQEPAKPKPSVSTDRTGESQANDDPSSAPESGDKEP